MGTTNERGILRERALIDDDPTNEIAALDLQEPAAEETAAGDPGIDPSILALRKVDAEIRQVMDNWIELQNQLDDRDAEISRLRDQGRSVEEEAQVTRNELATARSDFERLREEVEAQRTANEAQNLQHQEYRHQAEILKLELASALARSRDLQSELDREKASRNKVETTLATHRDALAGMAAELRTFEKARGGHDHDKAALAARIADLERHSTELSGRRREAEEQLLEKSRHADVLEGELRQARELAAQLDKSLQTKTAVTAQIDELQRELNIERERASAFHQQITTSEQAISQVETALAHQRQETEAALTAASRSEQALAEHRARLDTLADVETKAAALADALATAQAAAVAAASERDKLSATSSRLNSLVSTLEAERNQLTAQLDEVRAQLSAVDSEFQAKRRSITALGMEFDRLGLIQANVRKLESMMTRQLTGGKTTDGETERSPNVRLVVSLEGDKVVKYPLFKPDMVIGRSRDTDIRIAGRHASRRHARIFVDDGVVMIEDLGSLNGITVNEKSVRRHELHDGDVLNVGGARLRFVDLDEKASPHRNETATAH